MKKVLIAANLAGFASFLLSDIDILTEMGYEIHFMANCNVLPWNDTKIELIKRNVKIINVEIDSKNPFKIHNILEFFIIKKILKTENYSLIHCHTPIIGFIVRLAAKGFKNNNCKVIYTSHGFSFNKNSSKKSWFMFHNLEKIASKYCDAIITINNEDYKNALSFNTCKCYLINGVGVDLSKYSSNIKIRKEYRIKLGIGQDKIVVLSVGELSVRKNHQLIIKAISHLNDKERYIYVICGNGVDDKIKNELVLLSSKLGVNVLLLGFRKDIPEITNCSDIGAIPSLREGLGLAGIQSLACGVPLVGSNVQGIKDYIINNKTGYLFDAFDDIAAARAIKKLSNKHVRDSMKKNCLEMAQKYSIDISRKQRKDIYDEILGDNYDKH